MVKLVALSFQSRSLPHTELLQTCPLQTVQSISLLAYLAEKHDIWGPFLVVAPASTLHNWQQEITRFVPSLKALPYWGSIKDRTTLRKFWNKKYQRYDKDTPFHVLVTSYQIVVADEKYFQRVKWQYMILDEAQAIKSSGSARWKALLNLNCRNRLLLTGSFCFPFFAPSSSIIDSQLRRYANPELNAGALGFAPLYHATALPVVRRVLRLVFKGY